MTSALKDRFGLEVPRELAARTVRVWPEFPAESFLREASRGFDELELTDRARHVAAALARALPDDFPAAADILEAGLGPPRHIDDPDGGMDAFVDLPLAYWVAEKGLDHPERALAFQRELTRRFSAEFSIRPYLEAHPSLTMATLATWTSDPDGRVRRLVSEGTRPRLPWASQLTAFRRDPTPVLPLLEALRDDPSSTVRRSVANHLNDIAKDHPDLVIDTARRWMVDADEHRRALVRHGLRTLLRDGNPDAFAALGLADSGDIAVDSFTVEPPTARIGGHLDVKWAIRRNAGDTSGPRTVMVHLRVHYARPRGTTVKTFIIGDRDLPPGDRVAMRRRLSLRQMSTRTHHPGHHRVELLLNGTVRQRADVEVLAETG